MIRRALPLVLSAMMGLIALWVSTTAAPTVDGSGVRCEVPCRVEAVVVYTVYPLGPTPTVGFATPTPRATNGPATQIVATVIGDTATPNPTATVGIIGVVLRTYNSGGALNIRQCPSTSCRIVGVIPEGASASVYQCQDQFDGSTWVLIGTNRWALYLASTGTRYLVFTTGGC